MIEIIKQIFLLKDLRKRISFTLMLLLIFRLGTHIPIPGINLDALKDFITNQGGGLLGIFNVFTGGAFERCSILALGIVPYISASIILQILTVLVPHLQKLSKEGEAGRKKITRYTRYGTVILAMLQGYMIAMGIEAMGVSNDYGANSIVLTPGLAWRVQAMIFLTAGTSFLMWLGERITEKGIGNGISLIIFSGIVAGLPSAFLSTFELIRIGELGLFPAIAIAIFCILVVVSVVFIENGKRKVIVKYDKRQTGKKPYGGQSTHIPLKINIAGVIPPIFASSLMLLPVSIIANSTFSDTLGKIMDPGSWLYNLIFMALIFFFAFFYTSIVFNPDEIAQNLKKNGGYIPGVRSGKETADFIAMITNRLNLIGGIYLSLICIIPTILISHFNIPFYFGGTSLLIVVGVALDTTAQIENYVMSHQYQKTMEKSF